MMFGRCLRRLKGPQLKGFVRFQSTKSNPFSPSKLFANGVLGKTVIFVGGAVFGGWAYQNELKKEAAPVVASAKSTLALEELDSPQYATNEEIDEAIVKIKEILKQSTPEGQTFNESLLVSNSKADLDEHADTYFNTHHAAESERSRYVVYPRSTQEVSAIVKVCHDYRIPVVATGGRSSLEGHFIPTRGGISLDLTNMDQIIRLDQKDLDVTVQAGLGWETLNDYLEDYRLMFPVDPGPGATVGACFSNNSSGTNATRYGAAYKNVISLTVVLADGEVVKLKKRPKKSSAGYNLNCLFTGSEGTLGIITEVTVQLHIKPRVERVAVVPFKTIKDAADSVNSLMLAGVTLNAIELLDGKMMEYINKSGETSRKWTESPTLFLKLGGSNEDIVKSLIEETKKIGHEHNATDFQFATSEEETTELWSARKVALWSTINQGKEADPECQLWTTDAAVPMSHLPQFLEETKRDIDNAGFQNTLVAHIGDGNAHSFILYNPTERARVEQVVNNLVRRAINLEGTCTGEHGIGYGKIEFLEEELGTLPIDVMRKIKLALDPRRILNPDKIFKIDPHKQPEYHGDIHPSDLSVKQK